MADRYFDGMDGWALYRVTDNLEIYYLEWDKKRWKKDNSLARVVTPVGGEQDIEDITKARAREILEARFNESIATALLA
jgi:hypothetical protein